MHIIHKIQGTFKIKRKSIAANKENELKIQGYIIRINGLENLTSLVDNGIKRGSRK